MNFSGTSEPPEATDDPVSMLKFTILLRAKCFIPHVLHFNDFTCVILKILSAISPISWVLAEQAVPRIISLVGCDGSVCWMK